MIIYLDKIYSDLECWRAENKITAESVETELESKIMEFEKRLKKIEKVVVYHNERLSNELSK